MGKKANEDNRDDLTVAYMVGYEHGKSSIKYKRALEEIREVYAGEEGFIPETAPEEYQQNLLYRMYKIAVDALQSDKG